jgi:hypothetical protein
MPFPSWHCKRELGCSGDAARPSSAAYGGEATGWRFALLAA